MIWLAVLSVIMRSIHILSVIVILGGALFAVMTSAPIARFGNWLRSSAILAVISGAVNLMLKQNIPPMYHMWFGIKMLFALHIVSVSILIARSSIEEEKRMRLAKSMLPTGVFVVILSAYLRFLSNWMMV